MNKEVNIYLNRFVWALLLNRIELAKLFWRIGEFQTTTALFASILLKNMAPKLNDLHNSLNESSVYFENTACQVLAIFDKNSNDLFNDLLFYQKVPYYNNLDCITLALQGSCLKFISVPSVQNLVTKVWDGEVDTKRSVGSHLKVKFVSGSLK